MGLGYYEESWSQTCPYLPMNIIRAQAEDEAALVLDEPGNLAV